MPLSPYKGSPRNLRLATAVFLTWALFLAVGCRPSLPAGTPRLVYVKRHSPTMGRIMSHTVYVPRKTASSQRLPLVVFLHGSGDGPDALERFGITQLLDQGLAPPAIILSPQGNRGFWENWANGKRPYRDWILRELLPQVAETYGAGNCPNDCHVIGISMGGYGAMSFAKAAPHQFATVTAISPPIFSQAKVKDFYESFWWSLLLPIEEIWGRYDAARIAKNDPFVQWSTPASSRARLLLAWGSEESTSTRSDLSRFSEHLDQANIEHDRIVFPGGHKWKAWAPVLVQALNQQLKRTPTPSRAILNKHVLRDAGREVR